MRPPVPYFGGKMTVAPAIAALLPDHSHYVEPYCGSLAVLLAKRPSHHETTRDGERGMKTATSKMTRTAWGLDTIPADEWREHAACSPDTAHLFDVIATGRPGVTGRVLAQVNHTAIDICRRCPVTQECLDDAVAHPSEWAFIRGGHVVHRGQIVPARPTRRSAQEQRHEAAAVIEQAAHDEFADAVNDLIRLGWSSDRIASALGIGLAAVHHHARAVPQ